MTQSGFLLSYTKFGDNDAVVHFFTEEVGFQSFFIRGIYSAKNKKKAYLQPLKELRLTINPRSAGGLLVATKIEQLSADDFTANLAAVNIAFFLADFSHQILRDSGAQLNIYQELKAVSSELALKNHQAHIVFLLRMLKLTGFYPLVTDSIYLNPESGQFEDLIVHQLFDEEISAYWRQICVSEEPYKIRISAKHRRALLDSAMVFYTLHYPNFFQPKSLDVLREIYQ